MAVTKVDLGNQVTGTLPHASLPTLLSGDIPANAANTSGTAANLSGTPAIPNGSTATTQTAGDSSTKLATTRYVDTAVAAISVPNFADNEVPSGTVNGSNPTFTLAHTPVSTSLSLYLNGVLQHAGAGNDYTIATNSITMLNVPQTGDTLLANYRF